MPRMRRIVWCLTVALGVLPTVRAERLAVQVYTTADGLPRNQIHRIVRDRDGYLWFLSAGGATRFDGKVFRSLAEPDGLPPGGVNDAVHARDGALWFATDDGLRRLDPGGSMEPVHGPRRGRADRFQELLEGRDGTLWAGAHDSLYRMIRSAQGRWELEATGLGSLAGGGAPTVTALAEGTDGTLWIGLDRGLLRRGPRGDMASFPQAGRLPSSNIRNLEIGPRGELWIAAGGAACVVPDPAGAAADLRCYGPADGLAVGDPVDILATQDGAIWVAGSAGIARLNDADHFRTYGPAEGLPNAFLLGLADDGEGDLWIGTESAGAVRLANEGFIGFGPGDGLDEPRVRAFFEDAGRLCVVAGLHPATLACFDGRRFHPFVPHLPAQLRGLGWGTHHTVVQDGGGGWWLPTRHGLAHWRGPTDLAMLARRAPDRIFFPGDDVFRVYEDARRTVWAGTITAGRPLSRLRPGADEFEAVRRTGAPMSSASAFEQDRSGNLWIGFYDGGLARVHDERIDWFDPGDGAPSGFVWDLHRDGAGRLWIGTSREGLLRVEDEAAARPRFVRAGYELSSSSVLCIVDDARGRLYVGTPLGVDRVDLASGAVTHFTTADGLPGSEVMVAHRDRTGTLWFGTLLGLARLMPGADHPRRAPPIRVLGIRIAGIAQPLAALGERDVGGLVLEPDRRQIDIEFGGLRLAPGGALRYQYRLDGTGDDWSRASPERAVHFANLAPGRYRVLLRALAPDGVASSEPAVVSFVVLRPLWQRWYALAAAAAVVGAALYGLYRARVRQLVELERIRTRIATDLHDDVGATLSQIAILGEVARQRIPPEDGALGPLLDRIAASAREMVDGMSDIVWSIDPQRDRLADLVHRMRRFGGESLSARGIGFAFESPDEADGDTALGPDLRRALLLSFKEAINNAGKHSGATRVTAGLGVENDRLALWIEDDGRGFDPAAPRDGHGLGSLSRRAASLGGSCRIESAPGRGTRIDVSVPRRARAAPR